MNPFLFFISHFVLFDRFVFKTPTELEHINFGQATSIPTNRCEFPSITTNMPTYRPPLYIAWTTVKPSGCRWKTWILAKGTNLIPGLISGNSTICPGQVFRLKAIEIAAARASPTVCLELNWSAAGGKANSRARRISLSQAPALELAK